MKTKAGWMMKSAFAQKGFSATLKILNFALLHNGFWRGRNRIDTRGKGKVCIRYGIHRYRAFFIVANDNYVVANDNSQAVAIAA